MILVDTPRPTGKRQLPLCRMFSDKGDYVELLFMASKLKLDIKWLKINSHCFMYMQITDYQRKEAISYGAEPIEGDPQEAVIASSQETLTRLRKRACEGNLNI